MSFDALTLPKARNTLRYTNRKTFTVIEIYFHGFTNCEIHSNHNTDVLSDPSFMQKLVSVYNMIIQESAWFLFKLTDF